MPWNYYISNTAEDDDKSFEESFNNLLFQCSIHKDRLEKEIKHDNVFRFLIPTDGDNDKIVSKTGKVFLKSKFLMNKSFKKKLIDYYKQHGIYVSGPKEIRKRDNTPTNRWIIELSKKHEFD